MNYFWALIFTLFLSSCVVEKGDVKVNIKKNSKTSQISSANVSAISIVNNQVIVSGNNLSVVSGLKINGLAFNELFTIESKSANQIVANANRAFSFDVSKIFELVLSDAHGSAAFPISFDLPNASVTAPKLNPMGALTGQVLKYDGAEWVASTLSNSQIYLGTYDATLNVPNLNITSPISGDYYIVTTAGTFNAINYEVGDWIMHNGSAWEKISNSSNVVSSFNGRRGIVVPANGDYSWTMLTTASGKLTGSTLGSIADIDLTGIANNKVLKWDATNLKWIIGDDLSGGGAGTVTSTEISDDSITNADINSAAAIAYSKLNVPAGAIAYAKLSVADNEIPAIKVNGLSSAISGLLTATVADADTTHAPTSDAVFDALGLKLNLAGGTLTPGGTIAGLPALPLAGSEATSKDYVDAQITTVSTSANGKVSKIGDTMTGVLTLDSDLKIKGVSNYVSLKANGAMAADYNFTLPVSGGTAGYVLATDGTGGTSWINPAVNSTSITDGSIVNADVAAAANIDAAKLATGVVDNTEFNYLNGVTSAIQTQLDNKQALDATLTSLSGFNTNGIMVQTAADTFVGRTIAGTANRLIVTDGNGVAGNPTIDIPTALLPSPLVGNVGSFLKATAADTALWSALTVLDVTTALTYTPVNKAGDTLSTGTLTVNGTAHLSLPAPTLLTDPTTKDYVDTQIAGASNQWGQSAGNVYRSSGNVGVLTTTPTTALDVNGVITKNGSISKTLAYAVAAATNVTINLPNGGTTLIDGYVYKFNLATQSTGSITGAAYIVYQTGVGTWATKLVSSNGSSSNHPSLQISGSNVQIFHYHASTYTISVLAEAIHTGNTTVISPHYFGLEGAITNNVGNVGIGTTTPGNKLDVIGGVQISKANTQLVLKDTDEVAGEFAYIERNGTALNLGTNNGTTSTIGLTVKDGNVGIGTTAPDSKLHINTNGNTTLDGITLRNGTNQRHQWYLPSNAHSEFMIESTAGQFSWKNSNGELVRIDSNGNVGIGTTAPTHRLHLQTPNSGATTLGIESFGGTAGLYFNRANGTQSAPLPVLSTQPLLEIAAVGYGQTGYLATSAAKMLISADENWSDSTGSASIRFHTRDSNTTTSSVERMRISGSGNVGIGETAPSNFGLDLVKNQTGNAGIKITNNATSAATYATVQMINNIGSNGGIWLNSSGSVNYGGANSTNLGTSTANPVSLVTTNAVRLFVAADGKVGIGTTAPSYNLHVVGNAGLSTGTAWTNASDLRLKDIHGDYEYGLNEVLKLHTVRYSYKKDNPLGLPSDFAKTGFIAQEVQKIIPDAVKKRKDGFLELNVDPIHWAVVNSIKDLYRKYILPLWESDKLQERAIASLKESNEKLKKEKDREIADLKKEKDREVAELKARLERLEKMLKSK